MDTFSEDLTVLKADSLRVKAEEAKARYQLMVIEDALSDRKESLNRLLGRDLLVEFSVQPVSSALPEELDLQAARKLALAQRPEIRIASIKKNQANLETRIEKTRYLPDISIQVNYLTTAGISFLPQNVGAVGALLTWQPWDWGQKRHNIAQKVIAEHEAVLTEEDARDQVLLDVDHKVIGSRSHGRVNRAGGSLEELLMLDRPLHGTEERIPQTDFRQSGTKAHLHMNNPHPPVPRTFQNLRGPVWQERIVLRINPHDSCLQIHAEHSSPIGLENE